MTLSPDQTPSAQDGAREAGRRAYEARFAGHVLGSRGVAPLWRALGPDVQAIWIGIATAISAPLLAELAAVRAQRDEANAYIQKWRGEQAQNLDEVSAHILITIADECRSAAGTYEAANAALKAEVERLRAALRPFCFGDPTLERILFDGMPDDASGTFTIRLGDLRAARTALLTQEHPNADR